MKIRILIVDDHAVLRSGLRLLINGQPDMEVVGETGEAATALEAVQAQQPDIVLMDLAMNGHMALLPLGNFEKSGRQDTFRGSLTTWPSLLW